MKILTPKAEDYLCNIEHQVIALSLHAISSPHLTPIALANKRSKETTHSKMLYPFYKLL